MKREKTRRVPMTEVHIYFVAFEPPIGGYSSMIFQLPRPVRETSDIRRMESFLDQQTATSKFNIVGMVARHRVVSVSLLEIAARPLSPEEIEGLKKAQAARAGAEEVIAETTAPVQKS